ncbi:MAG: serine acetyltransferase [Lachnospiraceae bacterium]|nr:serine acetyltransferase [Lachnospiraceae bacterium]
MEQKTDVKVEELVELLMNSTVKLNGTKNPDFFHDLDKKAILELINKLQIILFPDYFLNETYRAFSKRNYLTVLVEDVLYKLAKQIDFVLEYECEHYGKNGAPCKNESKRLAQAFMSKLPMIKDYLATDIEAMYDGDPAAYNEDEIIFAYPGLYAIMVHRIAHELHKLNIHIIPRIMSEHAHSVTGIDIHPGATIGKYFFIDHGTGLVIGETCIIGDNVKVYQGVTLGALSTKGGQKMRGARRHPIIEDNVTIYSGASILGGDTVIGKNAVIGGNVFITKSVPEDTTVNMKNQETNWI